VKTLALFPTDRPPATWQWHDRTLKLLRTALAEEQAGQAKELRGLHDGDTHDTGDLASEIKDRDELITALDTESVELSEIEAALERIRDGTYGICEVTSKPIPKQRLRVIPWTRYIREVAAEIEKYHQPTGSNALR
jgi:RNA polymerase-binding transcription factor DksA